MKSAFLSLIIVSSFYSFDVLANEGNIRLKKIEAILDLSGAAKQTLGLSEFTNQATGPCTSQPGLSEIDKSKISKIVSEELRPDVMLSEIKKKMEAEFSNEELDSLEKFYNQENIKSISRLEEEASSVAGYRAMAEYAKGLQSSPPNKDRVNLLMTIDREMKTTEKLVSMTVATLKAVNNALERNASEKDYEDYGKKLTPAIVQHMLIAGLYTYKDLSNEELNKYFVNYTMDKNVKKYSAIIIKEYENGFHAWGKNMGIKIKAYKQQAEILKKIK